MSSLTTADPTLNALLEGYSWTGVLGQQTSVYYNFAQSVEGGTPLNAAQQQAALVVMQLWSQVANVHFVASATGSLTFSQENLGGNTIGTTTTYFSSDRIYSSEVQIDDSLSDFSMGSIGFMTLLHEVGHALGLKHPGNYSRTDFAPFLSPEQDTIQMSVMSYNNSPLVNRNINPPETPMLLDIAAIQALYGANRTHMSGNNLYHLNGSEQTLTIWDADGNDTLSAAGYTQGVSLSLRAGADNALLVGNTVAHLALDVRVENLDGGDGSDSLDGDDGANDIRGFGGNDSIRGFGGNDTLYGGVGIVDPSDGNDTIAGGDGADFIVGNTGDDILYGGVGVADAEASSDTIYGGFGRDAIYGNAGDDFLYGGGALADPNDAADTIAGGKGSDYIIGNGGNDVIYGGGAAADPADQNDTIYAGVGDDVVFGNGGNDSIIGGPGNDQLHGGFGDDIYFFGSDSGIDVIQFFEGAGVAGGDVIQLVSNLNGSGITTAAAAVAAISVAGDGSAVLLLGGSNLLTIEGVGAALTEADFQIV